MKQRGQYAAVAARNAPVVRRIENIKADHPFWGYRRVWAHLNYIDKIPISQNKVHRLMKNHNLLVSKNMKLRASRRKIRPKPKPKRPNQWWGIDMTKVMIEGYGWLYVTIVIDWHSKKVVGYHAGLQSKAWHWLVALNSALNRQFPNGARGHNLNLMSDNGCQPTATSFMKACATLGIHQAFTSYNNPKGNADTERFMRTMKEELVWLQEWHNPEEFKRALRHWINHYNTQYLHSTLGYQTPERFEAKFYETKQDETPLKRAC